MKCQRFGAVLDDLVAVLRLIRKTPATMVTKAPAAASFSKDNEKEYYYILLLHSRKLT